MCMSVIGRRRRLGIAEEEVPLLGVGRAIAGAAAVIIPAHGFVVGTKGLMFPGAIPPPRVGPSPAGVWFKTFFGACIWAAAMAAGMLIYQHFLRRWEEKGFPVLPVAALTPAVGGAMGQMLRTPSGGIPLASPGGGIARGPGSQRQAEPSRQTSFLDEFEG